MTDIYNDGFFVRVNAADAVEWARLNNVDLPETGRMKAINEARTDQGLPVFLITSRSGPDYDESASAAPVEREPVVEEPVAGFPTTSTEARAVIMKRTSAGLRSVLFDELDDLRAGRSDPKKALAVAALAKTIVDSVRMELDFMKRTDGKMVDGLPTIDLVKA